MNISIRKASKEDLDIILELNKNLFSYETQFNREYNQEWTYSDIGKSYFQKRIENDASIVLLAEVDKKVVGYLVAFIDSYPFRSVNPIAEIENMFIEEKYRKHGIGKKLIDETKTIAQKRGAKRIKVAAFAQNSPAIHFYRTCGFNDFETILELSLG